MIVSSPARREARRHHFGMGLSALCLVHCLALPWLLTSLPLVMLAALPGSVRDNEWLHAALILPVLMVSGPVLLRGAPGRWQSVLVAAAFAALIGALFVDGETAERTLTIMGAGILIAAHWVRLRGARSH